MIGVAVLAFAVYWAGNQAGISKTQHQVIAACKVSNAGRVRQRDIFDYLVQNTHPSPMWEVKLLTDESQIQFVKCNSLFSSKG